MRLGRWEGKVGEMEEVEGSGCSDAGSCEWVRERNPSKATLLPIPIEDGSYKYL